MTGATRGLGRVTALAFAREGASAALDAAGVRETLGMIRAEGGEWLFTPGDVRFERDVEAMVAKTVDSYGRLDCWIVR